jgi:pentatricopeptide repeat protein
MLKHVSTLSLLDSLVPSLVCRARALSKPAFKSQRKIQDAPLLHTKIRNQIMAQNHNRRVVPDVLKDKRNITLVKIRKAIENQDLNSAITHWESMEGLQQELPGEEMYRLPDSTTKALHNLLHSQIRNSRTRAGWSDSLNFNIQTFAVWAATRGFTDTLEMLMFDLVQRREPQAILDLYYSYTQTLANTTTRLSEVTRSDDGLGLVEDESVNVEPGRESILLAVTAAYAMKDTFQAALDTYIAANIRIGDRRKQQLFRHLSNDIELQKKVQKYVERFGTAYIVAKPTALSKHIMNLAYPRSARLLEKLYEDILEGISGPEPYLAVDQATVSSTASFSMSEIGWTSFQTGFIRCERMDLAVKMWDDLAKCGFTPGVTMWTALLDTYVGLRDSNKAMSTWNTMLRKGIRPAYLQGRSKQSNERLQHRSEGSSSTKTNRRGKIVDEFLS